jgi:hypothetical protein
MEISQKATEPKFEPVWIRLDTQEEVDAMRLVASWSTVSEPFNKQLAARLSSELGRYLTT